MDQALTTNSTNQEPAESGFFDVHDSSPRERLAAATKMLSALPQVEIVMRHYFADGVYAREGDIPKGAMFAGRVHLKAQVNIISRGAVMVLTEDGPIEMRAPFTMVSPPGAQRAAIALEDTTWTTIIAADETDPDAIFNKYTTPTYEAFEVVRDELLKIIEG